MSTDTVQVPPRGISARTRVGLVIGAALAISLLFALVIPMTFGQFTAQTVNVDNDFSAGTLEMTNSKVGSAILSATNMKPGDVESGTVTITNSGTLSASLTLSQDNVTNHGPVGSGNLAAQLDLVIHDELTNTEIYNGKFNALPSTLLGGEAEPESHWAAGESHTFTFTVTFPLESGNEYQGTGASARFVWDAIQ